MKSCRNIYSNDVSFLQAQLQKLLLESASSFDTAHENFYQGLVLGLCAIMDNRYEVTSNRESGEGRYHIGIYPKREGLPGILIELIACKDCSVEQLKSLAQAALVQIGRKKYNTEMVSCKISPILKYGVAFCGKMGEIATTQKSLGERKT